MTSPFENNALSGDRCLLVSGTYLYDVAQLTDAAPGMVSC